MFPQQWFARLVSSMIPLYICFQGNALEDANCVVSFGVDDPAGRHLLTTLA